MGDEERAELEKSLMTLALANAANAEALKAQGAALHGIASQSDMLRDILTGTINGTTMLFAMLVTELDNRSALDKHAFGQLVSGAADVAEERMPDHQKGRARMDIAMFRKVAEILMAEQPKWTPIVIEGGLSDRDDRD